MNLTEKVAGPSDTASPGRNSTGRPVGRSGVDDPYRPVLAEHDGMAAGDALVPEHDVGFYRTPEQEPIVGEVVNLAAVLVDQVSPGLEAPGPRGGFDPQRARRHSRRWHEHHLYRAAGLPSVLSCRDRDDAGELGLEPGDVEILRYLARVHVHHVPIGDTRPGGAFLDGKVDEADEAVGQVHRVHAPAKQGRRQAFHETLQAQLQRAGKLHAGKGSGDRAASGSVDVGCRLAAVGSESYRLSSTGR
jgi:hypothetical protein